MRVRHVDLDPGVPVGEWPAEAIEAAIDRGSLADWRRLATEICRSPWGQTARTVREIASWREHSGVDEVLQAVVDHARRRLVTAGRSRWAEYVRGLRARTGLSMRDFAALAGTSGSRLSDYENARVAPTTDALARLEHAGSLAIATPKDLDRGCPPDRDGV